MESKSIDDIVGMENHENKLELKNNRHTLYYAVTLGAMSPVMFTMFGTGVFSGLINRAVPICHEYLEVCADYPIESMALATGFAVMLNIAGKHVKRRIGTIYIKHSLHEKIVDDGLALVAASAYAGVIAGYYI